MSLLFHNFPISTFQTRFSHTKHSPKTSSCKLGEIMALFLGVLTNTLHESSSPGQMQHVFYCQHQLGGLANKILHKVGSMTN